MEGCGAVSASQGLMPERWAWEWSVARKWMSDEVSAVAQAALTARYDEVIVADGHGNAHSIDPDALPDHVRLMRSWPRPLLQMQGVEDPEVKACAFIGYHAGPTTPNGLLAHSYSGAAFRSLRLNGESCSEGYLNAALAGEFGKAVVLVSGDEHTIEDARRYAPEAVGFVSKHAIGYRSQIALPPRQVRGLLAEAAAEALKRPLPKPFIVRGPYVLELEMTTQLAAEMLAYLPHAERRSAFTIAMTFDRIADLMRFVSFAMFYSPTGVIAV